MKLNKTNHFAIWQTRSIFIVVLVCGLFTIFGSKTATANTLTNISFSALPGNKVRIRLTLAARATTPSTFFVDVPPRLVLDFRNTSLALSKKKIMVGVGAVHSLTALEVAGRTRVVFNFNHKVPYRIQVRGNVVLLTINSGLTLATQSTSSRPRLSPSRQPSSRHRNSKRRSRPARRAARGIKAIDFRRGPKGQGQVLITLNQPNTTVNLQEKGKSVVLEVLNTQLPAALRQKLDVTDFATPVQSITSEAKGRNVRINVKAIGLYEYVAYQVDTLYTLEFQPLSPEEQAAIQKKKVVFDGERLTLNFQNIPVRTVLHLLGDFTNSNMVISDAVNGNLTLRLKNVPWDKALDIILKTKFLGKRERNNVMYIAPAADLIKQEQAELTANLKAEELAPLQLEMITINYADAAAIKAVLVESSASTTKSTTTASNPTQRTYGAQTATQTTSSNARLLSARGQVTVYEPTNSLIIQDTADQLEKIRVIIAKLDVPSKQVMIESRIVFADNTFGRNLGANLGFAAAKATGASEFIGITGNQGTAGLNIATTGGVLGATEGLVSNMTGINGFAATSGVSMLIGRIGSHLLQLELMAMQQEGWGEIVSSPRVIATNQQKATIEQGVEIAYPTSADGGGTTTEFKKAALSLGVTPRITADSRISMELIITNDELNANGGINTQKIETTVLVGNGETVVLGGVYKRNKSHLRNSVPFFSNIPILGHVFRSSIENDNNSELLIFITPKILRSEITSAIQ